MNDRLDIRGMVEIWDTTNDGAHFLLTRSNMILYVGRMWVLRKIFQLSADNRSQDSTLSLGLISWFGVGTGGCLEGNLMNPISPTPTDIGLRSQILINNQDMANPRYANHGYLVAFDSIDVLDDPNNMNYPLIVQVRVTLGKDDANGPINNGETSSALLNEAGLYISNTNNNDMFDPESLQIFAKTTFPTITKNAERILQFKWNIYV